MDDYWLSDNKKGKVFKMKVAIPTTNGLLCPHFGHCEKFVIADVDKNSKTILNKDELVPPPHEPGLLPVWLHEKGVNCIIAGGMGSRALQLFAQNGIDVVTGAPADHPQTVLMNWLGGNLVTGGNVCDH